MLVERVEQGQESRLFAPTRTRFVTAMCLGCMVLLASADAPQARSTRRLRQTDDSATHFVSLREEDAGEDVFTSDTKAAVEAFKAAVKEAKAAKDTLEGAGKEQKKELRKAFMEKRKAACEAFKAAMKLAKESGADQRKALLKLKRRLMKQASHSRSLAEEDGGEDVFTGETEEAVDAFKAAVREAKAARETLAGASKDERRELRKALMEKRKVAREAFQEAMKLAEEDGADERKALLELKRRMMKQALHSRFLAEEDGGEDVFTGDTEEAVEAFKAAVREAKVARETLAGAGDEQKKDLRKALMEKLRAARKAFKEAMKLAKEDGADQRKALLKLRRRVMKQASHFLLPSEEDGDEFVFTGQTKEAVEAFKDAVEEAKAAKETLDGAGEEQKKELRKAFMQKRKAAHEAFKAAMKLAKENGPDERRALMKLKWRTLRQFLRLGKEGTADLAEKFQIPSGQLLASPPSSYLSMVGAPLLLAALASAMLMRVGLSRGRAPTHLLHTDCSDIVE